MGNGIREKYRRFTYNPNYSRTKSGDKYKKALEWYVDLLVKEKKQWLTKWIEKTRIKASLRLKKYGITNAMLDKFINEKWLSDLLS